MNILETERLRLRWLAEDDAAFILELLNDPGWIRHIGDKGVRNLDDARNYILNGPVNMYRRLGYGLFLTELKDNAVPIGICGLLKRDTLDDVDLGFAFLPDFRAQGYARESAAAALRYGRDVLGIDRIVAITTPGNQDSIRLLEKLGFRFEQCIRPAGGNEELNLYASDQPQSAAPGS